MLKCFAFTLLASVASSVLAQDTGWSQVAVSSDGNDTYSVKLHSGERTLNKQGEAIVVVVGQISHKQPQTIEIVKWYVASADCEQGYGNLVILDIDGNYQGETAFAQGGKNIASAIAGGICAAGRASDPKSVGGKVPAN
jgi:hypothetical protein